MSRKGEKRWRWSAFMWLRSKISPFFFPLTPRSGDGGLGAVLKGGVAGGWREDTGRVISIMLVGSKKSCLGREGLTGCPRLLTCLEFLYHTVTHVNFLNISILSLVITILRYISSLLSYLSALAYVSGAVVDYAMECVCLRCVASLRGDE